MQRLRLTLVLLCALCVVPGALADGDPASDVLLTADAYFPTQAPSTAAQSALSHAVAQAYAHGNRLKVAVIASRQDLGSIPSLYGKPPEYAHFLGQELAGFYVGPLLIVEPGGFGIYDGGRSTSAESKALAGLKIDGSSPDALTESATSAVERLEAAGALRSADIEPPYVLANLATVHPGHTADLTYRVLDDSERAVAMIAISAGGKRLATLHPGEIAALYGKVQSVAWAVPKTLPRQGVKLCLWATDPSDNRSKPSCEQVKVER